MSCNYMSEYRTIYETKVRRDVLDCMNKFDFEGEPNEFLEYFLNKKLNKYCNNRVVDEINELIREAGGIDTFHKLLFIEPQCISDYGNIFDNVKFEFMDFYPKDYEREWKVKRLKKTEREYKIIIRRGKTIPMNQSERDTADDLSSNNFDVRFVQHRIRLEIDDAVKLYLNYYHRFHILMDRNDVERNFKRVIKIISPKFY